jgi:hypothetical protein
MTLNELVNAIREHLPECSVGEDNEGQIILYTNMTIDRNETLIPMEEV